MQDTRQEFVERVMKGLAERKRRGAVTEKERMEQEYYAYAKEKRTRAMRRRMRHS